MKTTSPAPISTSFATNYFSHCHRQYCRLRIIGKGGLEECLMESVRNQWKDPTAVNYCNDPASRKYVDLMHSKPLPQRYIMSSPPL